MQKNEVWRISYRYDVSHIDGDDKMNDVYVVVAGNEEDALRKGDDCFSYSGLNRKLLEDGEANCTDATLYNLRKNIKKYKEKVAFPKLSLASDKEKFKLKANISSDGRTREFIVESK